MKTTVKYAYEIGLDPVAVLHPDNSILQAFWLISAMDVQGLPVCDDENYIKGFVSLSDIAFWLPPSNKALHQLGISTEQVGKAPDLCVKDVMTTSVVTANPDERIKTVIDLLIRRHLIDNNKHRDRKQYVTTIPLVDDGRVVQTLSYVELLRNLDTENALIRDVITPKQIPTVHPNHSLKAANAIMNSSGQRFVLVTDESDYPIGMLSDVSILRHIREPYQLFDLPVSVAMMDISYLTNISPEDTVEKILPLFVNFSTTFKAFPVVYERRLVDVISYIDILSHIDSVDRKSDEG